MKDRTPKPSPPLWTPSKADKPLGGKLKVDGRPAEGEGTQLPGGVIGEPLPPAIHAEEEEASKKRAPKGE